jgi:Co/Zn/Cd efflux system component
LIQYVCNIYAERLKAREQEISKRTRFLLEIFIPSVSLCCLLIVTGYVTASAIHVIRRPSAEHEEVNIYFLYGFSIVNVLVDVFSSLMFFRKGDEDVFLSYRLQKPINSYDEIEDVEVGDTNDVKACTSKMNLNMVSAFTHLTGDSMRTTSVIIAASISSLANIPSNLCDAWAAIVVAITIVTMVIPLVTEIYKAACKMR